MLGCNGGVLDDYYYKARIFITNRLQNYFAMINRNHNPDKTCWAVVSRASNEGSSGYYRFHI